MPVKDLHELMATDQREKLNHITRNHLLEIEGILRKGKKDPLKETTKKICHRTRNFCNCLETLIYVQEVASVADPETN